MRTGLERLTNINSDNYCVIIIGADTSIWQTTASDTVHNTGGIAEEYPASYYFHAEAAYNNIHAGARLKKFQIEFEKYTDWSHWHNSNANCNTPDSIILQGNHIPDDTTIGAKYRFYVSLTDSVNNWAITRLANGAFIDVKSITPIQTTSGCKKLRVKGTLQNTYMYNSICGPVPVFHITEGAFQMDFQWPQ